MTNQNQDRTDDDAYDQLATDLQHKEVTDEALLGVGPPLNFFIERKSTSLIDL
jgi:hypothetical protein